MGQLNPNIIMQAGRGVTPIQQHDPYKMAAFEQNVKTNELQNRKLGMELEQAEQKGLTEKHFRRVMSIDDTPESYQQFIEEVRPHNPSLADSLPPYAPGVVEKFQRRVAEQSMGASAYGKFKFEQSKADRAQSNADRNYELARERTNAATMTAQAAQAGKLGSVSHHYGKKEESEMAKMRVNVEYKDVAERARAAGDTIQSLKMLRSIDVDTGALEPAKAWLAGIAQSAGVDPKAFGLADATNAQAFVGIAQNLVLNKMQAQKGPQTESDARRIERTVANLGNTPQARRFLTEAAIAVEDLRLQEKDFYDAWYEKHGYVRGADKAWRDRNRNFPFLVDNPVTGLPTFYNQFRDAPGNAQFSEDELRAEWQRASKGR